MTTTVSGVIPYPAGLLRRIAALPLWLHRLGLGWLMGWIPFIVMTTRGRTTGLPRHVVLEWRRHGSRYYVVSTFGNHPQWFRNLMVDPEVTIQHGSKMLKARAVRVTDADEAARAVYMFRKNSLIYELVLTSISSAGTIDFRTLAEYGHEFTVVRLEPLPGEPELPGVTGLPGWVVPMVIFIPLLLRIVRKRSDE